MWPHPISNHKTLLDFLKTHHCFICAVISINLIFWLGVTSTKLTISWKLAMWVEVGGGGLPVML